RSQCRIAPERASLGQSHWKTEGAARMKIHRVEVPGLAHYSYVLSSRGRCAVIDPRRDVDVYLDYARANRLEITHVLETHIHADYASGARELAERAGAKSWSSPPKKSKTSKTPFPITNFATAPLSPSETCASKPFTPPATLLSTSRFSLPIFPAETIPRLFSPEILSLSARSAVPIFSVRKPSAAWPLPSSRASPEKSRRSPTAWKFFPLMAPVRCAARECPTAHNPPSAMNVTPIPTSAFPSANNS